MTHSAGSFSVRIERVDGYEFRVRFDKPNLQDLLVDEPPPLGRDHGPNPARVLAAALGSCLSASLVFCLTRAKLPVGGMTSDVEVELVRNDRKRLRIGRVSVRLHPELPPGVELGNCLEAFEDFCIVTQSVRDGIDVEVAVEPVHAAEEPQSSSAGGSQFSN